MKDFENELSSRGFVRCHTGYLVNLYFVKRVQQEEARIRSIYHDLKNHLLILEQQNGTSGETQRMLESLKNPISDYENYTRTGNDFYKLPDYNDFCHASGENGSGYFPYGGAALYISG